MTDKGEATQDTRMRKHLRVVHGMDTDVFAGLRPLTLRMLHADFHWPRRPWLRAIWYTVDWLGDLRDDLFWRNR